MHRLLTFLLLRDLAPTLPRSALGCNRIRSRPEKHLDRYTLHTTTNPVMGFASNSHATCCVEVLKAAGSYLDMAWLATYRDVGTSSAQTCLK